MKHGLLEPVKDFPYYKVLMKHRIIRISISDSTVKNTPAGVFKIMIISAIKDETFLSTQTDIALLLQQI